MEPRIAISNTLHTCGSCRHFEQRERANVVRVDIHGSSTYGTGRTVVGHCNHDDAKFIVRDPEPGFGCIYHTLREGGGGQ